MKLRVAARLLDHQLSAMPATRCAVPSAPGEGRAAHAQNRGWSEVQGSVFAGMIGRRQLHAIRCDGKYEAVRYCDASIYQLVGSPQ